MSPMRQQLCAHRLPSADVRGMSLGCEEVTVDSNALPDDSHRSFHVPLATSCSERPLRQQTRDHPTPCDEVEAERTSLCFPSRGKFPLRCQIHTQPFVSIRSPPRISA